MAIRNRAWFKYNTNATGNNSQQDSLNYAFSPFFPSCLTTGLQICSVYGLYDPDNYRNHPVPFLTDSNLESYITEALAAGTAKPSGVNQKRYVYVRTI